MTRIFEDPAEFTGDALTGFVDLYPSLVRQVTGGVVRRKRASEPKVAIVVGGGSGHYPAFMGYVGKGFADGAVVGNIFTSPSTAQAYSVARAANSGAGVVFAYGNYAGDVMNFGLAGARLEAEGVRARQMIVTDDVASAPEQDRRRGIAGDFMIFKIISAAAEKGLDLDEVMRVGTKANQRTFTLGLGFSGCTFPGAEEPLFTVPKGMMGLGLGVHGEPGLEDVPSLRASELASLLVTKLLAERPAGSGDRVAAIVNGLGATKYEELYVLWGFIAALLRQAGLSVVAPEVGELITSLDMGGTSLTLTWLDEELEEFWVAPCRSAAFSRGSVEAGDPEPDGSEDVDPEADYGIAVVPGDAESQAVAKVLLAGLEAAQSAIRDAESELGALDAVAGDGDHGRGMVRGLNHAVAAALSAQALGAGAASLLAAAGDAWAEYAGGTSGVLWGAGLRASGVVLTDQGSVSGEQVVKACHAWLDTLSELGKASVGDKTLLDSAVYFVEALEQNLDQGLSPAWASAAKVAEQAAQATAELSPKVGRARPLAARSIGTPDPGAVSFALCVRAVSEALGDSD